MSILTGKGGRYSSGRAYSAATKEQKSSTSANSAKTQTFNTSSGGQGVTLTPAQQAKLAGTNVGANLGIGGGVATPIPQTGVSRTYNPAEAPNEALKGALTSSGISYSSPSWRHVPPNVEGVAGSLNVGALNKIALRNLKLAEGGGSASNIAVDNGTARDDEKKLQKEIGFQSQRAPLDLSYLTEAEQFTKKSLREGESGINANFDVLRRGQEAAQAKETGALSAGLARAGGYLGFTSSGESMMISLEKSHRAEMLDLEAKRTQALSDARQAYNDQMYDVAREKQKLATQYEREQWEEKQAYFAEVKRIQQEEAKAKDQERANMDIYSAIQGGAKNEFDVFSALQGKATPEQIASFFKAVGPKTTASDVFKPTNTQTAMLMGAGFGADDIQTIYDHLNEYGYDDVLKASLTPYQRRVMDDMLTLKPEKVASAGGGGASDVGGGALVPSVSWEEYLNAAQETYRMSINPDSDLYKEIEEAWQEEYPTSSGVEFTNSQKLKLEQAGLLNASRQKQLDFLYGGNEDDDGDNPWS